jgi:hypothetical protein
MEELVAQVQSRLRSVFAGRSVILAGGSAVGAARSIDQLRRLGVPRFLVVASGLGTGVLPEGRPHRCAPPEFVEGVPCSIHGFVVDDGVAAFRPVELVTLRAPRAARAATALLRLRDILRSLAR